MNISDDEILLDKLVDFIFKGIRDKHWLYWPPGPMVGQVFDKNRCKDELQRWLQSEGQ